MRRRVGIILIVSGLILIIKPNLDFDTMMMGFNYIAVHYLSVLCYCGRKSIAQNENGEQAVFLCKHVRCSCCSKHRVFAVKTK